MRSASVSGVSSVFDRDDGLQDDWAGVEIFVHEMHGAAAELDAVFERLALRLETRKRGQQRGMNIQDAARKGGDEIGREQAHESREADQVDAVFAERGDDQAVVASRSRPLEGITGVGMPRRRGLDRARLRDCSRRWRFARRGCGRRRRYRPGLRNWSRALKEHADAFVHGRPKLG